LANNDSDSPTEGKKKGGWGKKKKKGEESYVLLDPFFQISASKGRGENVNRRQRGGKTEAAIGYDNQRERFTEKRGFESPNKKLQRGRDVLPEEKRRRKSAGSSRGHSGEYERGGGKKSYLHRKKKGKTFRGQRALAGKRSAPREKRPTAMPRKAARASAPRKKREKDAAESGKKKGRARTSPRRGGPSRQKRRGSPTRTEGGEKKKKKGIEGKSGGDPAPHHPTLRGEREMIATGPQRGSDLRGERRWAPKTIKTKTTVPYTRGGGKEEGGGAGVDREPTAVEERRGSAGGGKSRPRPLRGRALPWSERKERLAASKKKRNSTDQSTAHWSSLKNGPPPRPRAPRAEGRGLLNRKSDPGDARCWGKRRTLTLREKKGRRSFR